jgi:hypothetical protein
MSALSPVERSRRRRRRWSPVRPLLVLAAALILFGIGVAVGMALHDNPQPGLTTTSVKTLHP